MQGDGDGDASMIHVVAMAMAGALHSHLCQDLNAFFRYSNPKGMRVMCGVGGVA